MDKPFPRPIHRGRKPDPSRFDDLAAEVLAYLAVDQTRLAHFFDATGLTVATLRAAAAAPDFLAHLLDYLTSDESRLRQFAAEKGYDPAEIEGMRLSLAPPFEDHA